MIVQSGHWSAGHSDVQDDDLARVHGHGGQVVGILLVPGQPKEWSVCRVFVDDGGVLQVSEIKHSDRPIGTDRGKHVSASTSFAESDVIHLFVVGNQLGLDMTRHLVHSSHHLTRLQSPDGTGGVDGGSAKEIGIHFVPEMGFLK